jgi:peroxiredoxin
MKSILILFVSILSVHLMVLGGNPVKETTISAQINGLNNDTIIAKTYLLDQPDQYKLDTIIAKNGKFTYEPDLIKPQIIQFVPLQTILTKRDSKSISGLLMLPSYIIELFVSPGEHIGILAKLNPITIDYQVSGSSFNTRYAKLKDEWKPLQIAYVENFLKTQFLKSLTDEQRASSIKQENKNSQRALDSIPKEYVVKHPHDSLSAFLALNNPWMYTETFLEKFRKLDTTVMTPYIRAAFSARIKHEEYLVEFVKSTKRIAVGAEAPDFTLKDDKGKPFTLSSLRGKYIILDFWGSWCSWCIKGFPEMINAQEKCKDYVAFVSVACKDEKRPEAWKNILEKYQLKWTQLINDDSDLKNDVISRYGLLFFPTIIMIDPQGKIIYYQRGESQDLYHRLDALLDELKKEKKN